jgi:hypothetical protein
LSFGTTCCGRRHNAIRCGTTHAIWRHRLCARAYACAHELAFDAVARAMNDSRIRSQFTKARYPIERLLASAP